MSGEKDTKLSCFGLSTAPIVEIKSELQKMIEVNLLNILYKDPK